MQKFEKLIFEQFLWIKNYSWDIIKILIPSNITIFDNSSCFQKFDQFSNADPNEEVKVD